MAEKENGLFDAVFRLRKIDSIGDPLRKLDSFIDWEIFRPILNKGFARDTPQKGPGGRLPFDYVLRIQGSDSAIAVQSIRWCHGIPTE
jgi:hypothetical protein